MGNDARARIRAIGQREWGQINTDLDRKRQAKILDAAVTDWTQRFTPIVENVVAVASGLAAPKISLICTHGEGLSLGPSSPTTRRLPAFSIIASMTAGRTRMTNPPGLTLGLERDGTVSALGQNGSFVGRSFPITEWDEAQVFTTIADYLEVVSPRE